MIIVTGGAGFLGSHLCERLLAENHNVVCIDNFYTGSIQNISHLTGNKKFKIIDHDITQPINHSFSEEVDLILNLACPASPIHYQKDPIKTVHTNVLGAINCLQVAERYGATIFQASTSEVYGDPSIHPQDESYWGNVNPIGIRSCYDEGKRCAETLFFDHSRQNGTKIKIARIFNTYGPRMSINDGRVISNFIVQALRNEPITIYGQGLQTRSFCYVDDLIEGILGFVLRTPTEITGPINLGNHHECTILEIAEMIIRLTQSHSKLIHLTLPLDDPKQRKPDISLAKNLLSWEPKVKLEDGLIKTINFFSKNYSL